MSHQITEMMATLLTMMGVTLHAQWKLNGHALAEMLLQQPLVLIYVEMDMLLVEQQAFAMMETSLMEMVEIQYAQLNMAIFVKVEIVPILIVVLQNQIMYTLLKNNHLLGL